MLAYSTISVWTHRSISVGPSRKRAACAPSPFFPPPNIIHTFHPSRKPFTKPTPVSTLWLSLHKKFPFISIKDITMNHKSLHNGVRIVLADSYGPQTFDPLISLTQTETQTRAQSYQFPLLIIRL